MKSIFQFLALEGRAVIVNDDIDKKGSAIFISIQKFEYRHLSILGQGQARIAVFFLEAVSNQASILQDCTAVCTRHFKLLK